MNIDRGKIAKNLVKIAKNLKKNSIIKVEEKMNENNKRNNTRTRH